MATPTKEAQAIKVATSLREREIQIKLELAKPLMGGGQSPIGVASRVEDVYNRLFKSLVDNN